MEWSPQQVAVLKDVSDWLGKSSRKQVYRMFGFAGSGKTTLAKHLAKTVNGKVIFAAFTGKAAHVMRQNGCDNAATIHSLIYTPKQVSSTYLKKLEAEMLALPSDCDPRTLKSLEWRIKEERRKVNSPAFNLKEGSDASSAGLIIIDECSMVNERMGSDLMGFGVPILVLGDPAQLPPIGSGGFFTATDPDTMLTEIHRQSGQSPIIEMATVVRNGGFLQERTYSSEGHEDSVVLEDGALTKEIALGVDQIIVGRNKTRRSTNKRMRGLLGFETPEPAAGDRIVCLRNNNEKGLMNGSLWNVLEAKCDDTSGFLTVEPAEGGPAIEVESWMHAFLGRKDDRHWGERSEAEEFDFGYALTCHKAQGSQFESVLVIDESSDFRAIQHRWLYTALTRASKRVVVA